MSLSAKEKIREARKKHIIPSHILNDPDLKEALLALPENYNFELPKTIWHIKQNGCKRVALQFPEGLIVFSLIISEIIERFCGLDTVIMGDVSYGACCIDDYTASLLDCDMIVHYGHSCLVPIDLTPHAKVLYIFVDIKIDLDHFVDTICTNFKHDSFFAFITTIQFASDLHACTKRIKEKGFEVMVPQAFPLSKGEVLGCTSPILPDYVTDIVYLGDGRFHIESLMIQSPHIPAFKYDPYTKEITRETLDICTLIKKQETLIKSAIASSGRFGIVLGTLGRQGNISVFENIIKQLKSTGRQDPIIILVSELHPDKLKYFGDSIDVWVQIACPRLSIDWSSSYHKPLLTTYELSVVTGHAKWTGEYPMDYYAADSLGPWTPNHNIMEMSKLRKRVPKSTRTSVASSVID